MQDFIDQASKNNIILINKGNCQFCGGNYQNGVFECMDNYNLGLPLFDFNKKENHYLRFLCVDAHALQHPEIHGRWSNHFHLTRLHMIITKKIVWDYNKSTILSDFLNEYKINRPNEVLDPPQPCERGLITAKEVNDVSSAEECIKKIKKWAIEVYNTWSSNHQIVSVIADELVHKKKHLFY